jgi:two-component system, NtrC family, response regulator HydG
MKSGNTGKILVVDDDRDVLFTARMIMKDHFEKVDIIDRPGLIPEYLKGCRYDAIVLDMNFSRGNNSGMEGLEWLRRILQIVPEASVMTTTAYGDINLAVQAMKLGAVDFMVKPWQKDKLIDSVKNLVQLKSERGTTREKVTETVKEDSGKAKHPEMISRSPVMAQILDVIKTVAPTDANVLIMGENGTGKELAALMLHKESLRNRQPFVHVDLGAIPETLFESELFGHTRGAFTDAREEREGRFESASGGTLFLDEIGNLGLPLQAKILTAIQNREVIRIGSNRPVPVSVRLISATNMPIYQMAESFGFRQDLLYRINTVEITLPPLRERKEDIPPIADYYTGRYSVQYNKPGMRFGKDTLKKLEEYHWPGNIRELAHAIERAVILCKSQTIMPEDFVFKTKPAMAEVKKESAVRLEEYEKRALHDAIDKFSGNLSLAARELGIARSTLYRKIVQFGM